MIFQTFLDIEFLVIFFFDFGYRERHYLNQSVDLGDELYHTTFHCQYRLSLLIVIVACLVVTLLYPMMSIAVVGTGLWLGVILLMVCGFFTGEYTCPATSPNVQNTALSLFHFLHGE